MLKRRKPEDRKGPCHLAATLAWLALVPVAASAAPGDVLKQFDNPMPFGPDAFGFRVRATDDLILIHRPGGHGDPASEGKIYIYEGDSRSPDFGNLILTIHDPSPATGDGLNRGVAADAKVILAGDAFHDAGANNTGAVWVFDGDRTSMTFGEPILLIPNPDPMPDSRFGEDVTIGGGKALIGANRHVVAGLSRAGAAFLFDVDPGSPGFGQLLLTIPNPTPQERDEFATVVHISGMSLYVNCPGDDADGEDSGSVYVFEGDAGSPAFGAVLHRFANPEPEIAAGFSSAMAVSADLLAISATGDHTGAPYTGAIFLFDTDESSSTFREQLIKILNPMPGYADAFGYAVAITDSKRLIASSPFDFNAELQWGDVFAFQADRTAADFGSLLLNLNSPDPNGEPSLPDWSGLSVGAIGESILVGEPGYGNSFDGQNGRAWLFSGPPLPTPSPPPTTTPPPSPTPTAFGCCPGDADNSAGLVDAFDFISVQANFGVDNGIGGVGDSNCSGGIIDGNDFLSVQISFGHTCP